MKGGDTLDRMLDYYGQLDAHGFLNAAVAIRKHLARSDFPGILGERILDKQLMLRGICLKDPGRAVSDMAFQRVWHRNLPPKLRTSIAKLAKAIVKDKKCHLCI